MRSRGVGTGGGGGKAAPSFQKTQKVPFFWWQSALCLREKCCSDCIFDSRMLQSNICESLWLLECGAVKQWEMIGAHSLPANRAFQNRKSGWSTTNGKICTVLVCKNNLQTALILSVNFIWSHPWVGHNGFWFMIAFIFLPFPPPLSPTFPNISFQRFPSKPVPPRPTFWCFLRH